MGAPVVLSTNGIGFPVRPTSVNAPSMSLSSNGFGMPIILDNKGTPFVVQDFPTVYWNMQPITMTAGTNGQHVGYSTGAVTLPQPAFGSISGQPTSITTLLAFYNDTASGRYLAVFQGDYLLALVGLKITIGGFPITSYEAELIGGNTWLRFTAGLGNLTPGAVYELVFIPTSAAGGVEAFAQTRAILAAGGDYYMLNNRKLDRMWQEATGQTPAAVNLPVGLGLTDYDNRTFADVMAAQPELRGNFSIGLVGSATAASFNPATGVGSLTRVDAANQSFIRFTGLSANKDYLLTLNVPASDLLVRRDSETGGAVIASPATGDQQFVLGSGATAFLTKNTVAGTSNFTVVSLKEVPAHYAIQTVANQRGVLQADGKKYDGSDDNDLTDWFAQAGANCILAQITVPAVISATQVIAMSRQAAGNRLSLGLTTAGLVEASVGGLFLTIPGLDLRGRSAVVGMCCDGTTLRLFAEDQMAETAQGANVPNTVVPFRIGSANNDGVAANFFGGSIKTIPLGKVMLTPAQFQTFRNECLTTA